MRTVLCKGCVHCREGNGKFAAVSKHHIMKTTRQVKTLEYYLKYVKSYQSLLFTNRYTIELL